MDRSNSTASHFTQALSIGTGLTFCAELGRQGLRVFSENIREAAAYMYSDGAGRQIVDLLNNDQAAYGALAATFALASGAAYLSIRAEQGATPTPEA